MTRYPSHNQPRINLLHAGTVGERCLALLAQCQVDVVDSDLDGGKQEPFPECDVQAIVVDRPHPALLRSVADRSWDAGVPFISTVITAHTFRIGPVVVPQQTPCFECWSRRIRACAADVAIHDAIDACGVSSAQGSWFNGELSPLTEQVAALSAAEILSVACGTYELPQHGQGRYLESDVIFGSLQPHLFSCVGLCERCAAGQLDDPGWRRLAKYYQGRLSQGNTPQRRNFGR